MNIYALDWFLRICFQRKKPWKKLYILFALFCYFLLFFALFYSFLLFFALFCYFFALVFDSKAFHIVKINEFRKNLPKGICGKLAEKVIYRKSNAKVSQAQVRKKHD